jgi:leukotriene-A4 hydrolase
MTKEQTACKTMEYLFTQCEDVACRSIAPMQDTPANRITYTASVTVNKGFDVRMSANRTSVYNSSKTQTTYVFKNTIPMPSYLIALAVGDLEYKALDYRTGVITEPCKMAAVAEELSDLPMYLNKTEAYLTPYIWGSYTILILPPSFPFGGMENPLLTFASPTIITGDKS